MSLSSRLAASRASLRSLVLVLACGAGVLPARAADTPAPASVTVAGSLQSELGCPADWQPECASSRLVFDAEDGVWQAGFALPAGSYEYKAALNGSWDENYGQNAQRNGANILLSLAAPRSVKFYYDHETHWIADELTKVVATVPGSYQSLLGCASNWDPACLRSWLQDADGDGVYSFRTRSIPAGNYEAKVAIRESWAENYGQGGVPNGSNISFTVPADCTEMLFRYDPVTHLLSVQPAPPAPQPQSVTIAGSLQSELGCAGDWDPSCTATQLAFEAEDGVWQAPYTLAAGSYEYKAALDGSWDENYGQNAQRNGANIPLSLAAPSSLKFYYDDATHWVTDGRNRVIATAPGSYQTYLGCPGNWDPACLRAWLQDPDGDGLYSFSTRALPAGDYEVKAAIDESWAENYGQGGQPNGANIPFNVPSACALTTFLYDASSHLLSVSAAGAPRGNLKKARAHWLTPDTIAWDPSGPANGAYVLHYAPEGGLQLTSAGVQNGIQVPLSYDPAGLSDALKARFPYLASYQALKLPAARLGEVPAALRGQVAVSAADAAGQPLDATALQIPGVLDQLYGYDGPLGVGWSAGVPTLRLWAPTATNVRLRLYQDSNPSSAASSLALSRDDATGVWSITGDASWKDCYYLFEVQVFVRSTGVIETNLVTDPYALSLSRNSQRSQIVDLEDPALLPAGWGTLAKPKLEAPEDVSIYELHVRDFSASDASVPEALRGTFAAFALPQSNGMRHLQGLAQAGLTHVHLLPAFDFATVDEDRSTWQSPGDLSALPADSSEQQAAVAAVKGQDGFNWGYDPWHYTVPEGSYSSDPDGSARIREFRGMVQGLNQAGLRVVMDVVYNHTTASGQGARSVLDRVVPGYYHRLNTEGEVERSSCCENTASEHRMMEKLMIDSLLTWARAYKVDGFRFDLMGHHMKSNLVRVRAALDALTPAADGVDGPAVYVYGEGWNFGEVAGNARGENASQLNLAGTGIGSFTDRLRDAARGGSPFAPLRDQGFLTGLADDPNGTPQGSPAEQLDRLLAYSDRIRVGLAGNLAGYRLEDRFGNQVTGAQVDYFGQPTGYTADPQEVINYVDAHDNETWFDTVQLKAPDGAPLSERLRMHNLGVSLVGLAQGVPFFHAGIELLRSKSMDRNSYDSGDWFNRLDWSYASNNWGVGLPLASENQGQWPILAPLLSNQDLRPTAAQIQSALGHYREVLGIRASSPLFRLRTAEQVQQHLRFLNTGPSQAPGVIVMSLEDLAGVVDRRHTQVVAAVNGNKDARLLVLPALAGLPLRLHPLQAASGNELVRTASFDDVSGAISVPGRTAAVFWANRPLVEQIDLLRADVQALVSAGHLHPLWAQLLDVKLRLARLSVVRHQPGAAKVLLRGFAWQAHWLALHGWLDDSLADALAAEALAIAAQL